MNEIETGILKGLEEAVQYSKGELQLKTTRVKVAEIESFSADEVKQVRKLLCMGQKAFADVLGVSYKTVEAWESGKNTPNGPSSRLISILKTNPALLQKTGLYEYAAVRA